MRTDVTDSGRDTVKGAQSIARAFELLRFIAKHGSSGAGLSDLSQSMELPHPTIHRMLQALVAEGAVLREMGGRKYKIGPTCFELGLSAQHSHRIAHACRAGMDRIAAATADSVYLVMRSDFHTICLDLREAKTMVRTVTLNVGDWRPLGVGAAGVALLASLPLNLIDECLELNRSRYNLYRGLSVEQVEKSTLSAREDGIATVSEHMMEGITAFGIHVETPAIDSLLAVSVAGTSSRMNDRSDFVKSLLRKEAILIADELKNWRLSLQG